MDSPSGTGSANADAKDAAALAGAAAMIVAAHCARLSRRDQ